MKLEINWKKKIFTAEYRIYSYGKQVGQIKEKPFFKVATAVFNDRHYLFKTTGFFQQHTKILDKANNRLIGEITYGTWLTKASISIDGEVNHWKYTNTWNTRWSVFNKTGVEIKYCGSASGGTISSNTEDALLILSGLFIPHYFWQITLVILMTIFIPLLINN